MCEAFPLVSSAILPLTLPRSLRHLDKAFALLDDLFLDPNVFLAFYVEARKRFFLESLHFVIEVRRLASGPICLSILLPSFPAFMRSFAFLPCPTLSFVIPFHALFHIQWFEMAEKRCLCYFPNLSTSEPPEFEHSLRECE